MTKQESASAAFDPLKVLGLPTGVGEQEVRARYLELIKQFPPEREPERFREIYRAYQAARDPLILANQLLTGNDDDPQPWTEIIEHHAQRPPRLSPEVLLSLGNRSDDDNS